MSAQLRACWLVVFLSALQVPLAAAEEPPAARAGQQGRLPFPARAEPAGNLKPLGAWFAGYERLTFDDEIAWGSGAYVVSHYNSADFYEPFRTSDLPNYSTVYFGRFGCKLLGAQDQEALKRWVADGGNLVLSGEEGQRAFGNKPPDWLGIERWVFGKPVAGEVQKPNHPLAKDVKRHDKDPAWQSATAAVGKSGSVSILGKGELALLLTARHGKGNVVYLSDKLAPHRRPAYLEKQMVHDLSPLARQVWSNLLDHLGTPRRADVIHRCLADLPRGTDAPLRVWWRYRKATPLGARLCAPPCPRRGEELSDLVLDMGQGERMRRDFFVTSTRDQQLKVAATDLIGPAGSRIPASECRLFIQERPVAGYDKAAYWLVPLADTQKLSANDSYTFWLIAHTPITRTGTYRGAIEFRAPGTDGKVVHRLGVTINLHDVRCPSSELLHHELEHIWFAMPGGYWIEKDRSRQAVITLDGKPLVRTPLNNLRVLADYIRALGDLEVDFAQNWSDVDRLYTLQFLRLREGGALLSQEVEKHPERFRGKTLPALGFSAGYDEHWDLAIAAGMRCASMNYNVSVDGTLTLARRIAGDEKLTADSEFAQRIRTWYWSEYHRYLRERGLQGVYTKILDEFGPKGVPDFIKSARAIRPSGIKTFTSTYNFDRDRKAILAIDPHLDLWLMAWPRQNPFELYRELRIPFDRDNEVWGTSASSYWGNIQGDRSSGWLAARLGYGGVHAHGYMRWFWNDHEGCFPGPDGPYNSVAVTTRAQGIVEGRYLAQLRRMIDYAKRTDKGADVAARVDREWRTKLLGTAPTCLMRIRHQPGISGIDAMWWTDVCVSPATYESAKREVLELTARLKRAIGPVPRDVRFGDFVLVKAGNAVCRVVADPKSAGILMQSVPELKDGKKEELPRILMGTLTDSAELREYVKQHLSGQITAQYPRAGHYAIRMVPQGKTSPAVLLIVGGDREGLNKAGRNFLRLLTIENQW